MIYLRIVSLGALFTLLMACDDTKFVDVSGQQKYSGLVGATFIIVDRVDVYGIRKHSKAPVAYLTLIPPPGIEGPEVEFRAPVPIGSKLSVLRIYETNRLFDGSLTFEVALTGIEVPANVPIRVDLTRGNQGSTNRSLNPKIFRRN
jgi:hypothetical protein